MAIIQQIQQKTGCLFLIILGSLLLFVISDLIKSDRGGIFGNDGLKVGEIRGEKISYEEFNTRLNTQLAQLEQNNPGMKVDEAVRTQYSEQTWNSFLQDKIFAVEYAKIGVTVSGEELADMTIGEHPDEQVVRAFTQQGGQFDKNRLIIHFSLITLKQPFFILQISRDSLLGRPKLVSVGNLSSYRNLIIIFGSKAYSRFYRCENH